MIACNISVYLKQKLVKTGEFLCSHLNIDDGGDKGQHFLHSMLCYFKKGKNATEMQRKICAVIWRRCCDLSHVSKVVCKVSHWRFLTGKCFLVQKTSEVDSDQIETLLENNQHYTMQEIANILKISQSSNE